MKKEIKNKIEKIKTIGVSLMAIGGIALAQFGTIQGGIIERSTGIFPEKDTLMLLGGAILGVAGVVLSERRL